MPLSRLSSMCRGCPGRYAPAIRHRRESLRTCYEISVRRRCAFQADRLRPMPMIRAVQILRHTQLLRWPIRYRRRRSPTTHRPWRPGPDLFW